jgi:hypothetical protein
VASIWPSFSCSSIVASCFFFWLSISAGELGLVVEVAGELALGVEDLGVELLAFALERTGVADVALCIGLGRALGSGGLAAAALDVEVTLLLVDGGERHALVAVQLPELVAVRPGANAMSSAHLPLTPSCADRPGRATGLPGRLTDGSL